MLGDNIRKYRKEKGFSQEELAVKLNVVRQTVSKWESGLSVPDAELLMEMGKCLDVPVDQLLGLVERDNGIEDLATELARVNELLTKKKQREILVKRANEKRGAILLLSIVSMLLALNIKNTVFSAACSAACLLFALIVLYRNLALLTRVTTEDLRMKTLRLTTIVNIGFLIFGIVLALLTALDLLSFSEREERMLAMLLIVCVMIFAGIVSPKLPFTRHTGLRLPWTVQDEKTWELAHRILGYISLPLALLYAACSLTIEDFETVTLLAVLLWVGIPGGLSGIYFLKKVKGRL